MPNEHIALSTLTEGGGMHFLGERDGSTHLPPTVVSLQNVTKTPHHSVYPNNDQPTTGGFPQGVVLGHASGFYGTAAKDPGR